MEVHISVRNLVEFILREGDIDNRHKAATDTAMQEGSRIHRMIQKSMGIEYEAEVALRHIRECENYRILVDGRADGVIHKDGEVTIDEIKGTYRDIYKMEKPEVVHLAQAMCYAYMVADLERLTDIKVRMTYCNMDTEEIRYFHESFTFEMLSEWFEKLMLAYQKWADFEYEWKEKRKASIKELTFPFSYREGQKELAGHVYQTICHQKKLFIQAPTGVGKTISTLFPAIKAVGEQKADKIFYLTAKTITRTVAENTFSLLKEKGLAYKTLTLTAKEKACPMAEVNCNPEYCPYAKGHFDRINDAIYEMLIQEDTFDRAHLEMYADRFQVCPFEMALDMSLFCDAIICDYNYLFDPYVYLKRYFAPGVKGPYLFLVDEAHNLVERGRSMYSSELIKEDFLALKHTIAPYGTKLEKYIDRCNKQLLALKKETDGLRVLESTGAFDMELTRLHSAISTFLEEVDDCPVHDEILDFYFKISRHLDVNERLDENYVIYAQNLENGDFMVKQFCVNPANRLKECMQLGIATILFSATFLPIQYHKQLLGGDEKDFEVYAKSSFDPQQMKLIVGRGVTSKYTRRNEREYYNIAAYIDAIVKQRKGNYMIFCPSHAFLEEIYLAYKQYFADETTEYVLKQSDRMTELQREQFLRCFESALEDVTTKTGEIEEKAMLPLHESKLDAREKMDDGWNQICMDIEIESETEGEVTDIELLKESVSDMEASDFFIDFHAMQNKSILGFCVLGGIFSEGIDLKGESLIGAIIIGTGLPQVCEERELLKMYFDEQEKNGFDYAYRYPGMNKVLQAAGRVIRTAEDRGVVALLDERFLQSSYLKLFPREWAFYEPLSAPESAACVSDFWGNGGE